MSEIRKGTFLKQCQKCEVEMNGDTNECLRCKNKEGEEPAKNQKAKRDSDTYHEKEGMENETDYSDFITSDRSGRRNAIPDLQGDASLNLQKLASTGSGSSVSEGDNQAVADATEKESGIEPENQDGSSTL